MKYYYFYYVQKENCGGGICSVDGESFPLCNMTKKIREKVDPLAVISSWNEISEDEFEKMNGLINEINNEQNTEKKD